MGFIVILEDECKGCQLCVSACKFSLIHPSKSKVNKRGLFPVEFSDKDGECNACMLCAIVCPDVAIRVYREAKKPAKTEKAEAERSDKVPAGKESSIETSVGR